MNHVSSQDALPPGDVAEGSDERRMEFLRARVAQHPERIGMRIRLAHLQEACGRAPEALDTLRQAVSLAPGHRRAVQEFEALLERSGERPGARHAERVPGPIAPLPPPPLAAEVPVQADLTELMALPTLVRAPVDFGWVDPGRHVPVRPAARAVARPPRRGWSPPAELVAGLAIVAVVGLVGVLSRLHPRSLILRSSEVSLLRAQSGSPVASAPDPVTTLAPLPIPAAPVADSAPLARVPAAQAPAFLPDEVAPTRMSGAGAPPPLPATAPLDVTIFYRGSDAGAASDADQVASRLMRAGAALRVTGQSTARPGEAGIFYAYEEDGAGARVIASLLGAAGPVLRATSDHGDRPRPGAIAIVLPPHATIDSQGTPR